MSIETETIKIGDDVTIAGVFQMKPNPDRRWWQWWKPKMVKSEVLARYKITHIVTAT